MMIKKSVIVCFFVCASMVAQRNTEVTNLTNAQSELGDYLSNFDLIWNQIPETWSSGEFTGNGKVGTMIWGDYNGGIRFDIGNTEVYNGRSRVPMGKFILKPTGTIEHFKMRLSLAKAIVNSEIKTDNGTIFFETFTEINSNVQRIKYTIEGNEKVDFLLVALPPVDSNELWKMSAKELKEKPDFTSPEVYSEILKRYPLENYISNKGIENNIYYQQVNISKEVGYVLVWKHITSENGGDFVYASYYYRQASKDIVKMSLDKFNQTESWEEAFAKHKKWWANYYNEGFISIEDKRLEANYWVQYFKIGSATKKDGMPLDLLGPWYRATPWPRIWANLNIQITYPGFNQIGKHEEAATLFDYIDAHNHHFINAVPEEFRDNGASMGRGFDVYNGTNFSSEYGNLLWLLYNYSQFLEFFPDAQRTQNKYYPLLKRAVNFVVRNLEKDLNGVCHFPKDVSPEYFLVDENNKKTEEYFIDTNYNIGLLKWALQEVNYLSNTYEDKDPMVATYQFVSKNLVPLLLYPGEGLMIAKDVRMLLRHRHFSHLISYYPLGVLSVDKKDDYKLVQQSITQWLNRPKFGWGYKGYTYTVSTAMYARLGKGDKALEAINTYLDEFCQPNTFYIETGPVIETAMHSLSSSLELLLQSFSLDKFSNEIRVFTAVPSTWKEASFYKLKTEGGHKVSGILSNGKIEEIVVEVGKTEVLKVVLPVQVAQVYSSVKKAQLKWFIQGDYAVLEGAVEQGDIITIAKGNSDLKFRIIEGKEYHFGIN